MTDEADDIDDVAEDSGDAAAGPKRGFFGWVTRNSRAITALSAASIPVVLALIGVATNSAINKQNLDKEYVNLAITTLANKDIVEKCDASRKNTILPEIGTLETKRSELLAQTAYRQAQDELEEWTENRGDESLKAQLEADVVAAREDVATAKKDVATADAVGDPLSDEQLEVLEAEVTAAKEAVDEPLRDEQIKLLVGGSDKRALRNYAIDLLSGVTPFGVGLDKQQYVALLCGDVSVGVTDSNPDGPNAIVTSTEESAGDNSNISADSMGNFLRDILKESEPEDLPEHCLVQVTGSTSQLTTADERVEELLPPGKYRAVRAVSSSDTQSTKPESEADTPTRFVELENGHWVVIEDGVVAFRENAALGTSPCG